jgi:peptidoglycan/xylan/chitin deacetylase (PgdA/CDA1 family)
MKEVVKKFISGLIYISGIGLLFRRFYRHRIRVLMYHGVSEKDLLIWTQVPLQTFERQMSYIKRHYHTISLSKAVEFIKGQGRIPNNSLVITFDDGFRSNYSLAYPVLKEYGLPATIFLTTSFVDKISAFDGMIRTDYIVGLFRKSKVWKLDLRDQGFGVIMMWNIRSRINAGYRVSNALKRIDPRNEARIIEIIAQRLGDGLDDEDRKIFGSLNWEDVQRMHKEGLVTFGAHTVSHEILSKLSREMMICEVAESKEKIEHETGAPVRHFAYPNGTASDFNAEIIKTVSEYYDCALTTIEGFNTAGIDPFKIKRIGIGNDMKFWIFKLELSGALDFIRNIRNMLVK